MSERHDFNVRLAGLGSMVLHFSHDTSCPSPATSFTNSAFDGISYVAVPKGQDTLKRRAGRTPLGNISHDLNAVSGFWHVLFSNTDRTLFR